MKAKTICIAAMLLMIACQPLLAQTRRSPLPDLLIKKFLFPRTGPQKLKVLKVLVANIGHRGSAQCVLRLTVRKINGVSDVSRIAEIKVPALFAGDAQWVLIDASSILPRGVALRDTTFRLEVDPDDLLDEVNEKNNRVRFNQ
jgi:CARDB